MNKPMNPGIVATVEWLQWNGFRTTDSGDGQARDFECDQPVPYVHILVDPTHLVAETDRLVNLLTQRGVKLEPMNPEGTAPTVEAGYMPLAGVAHISLWNV